MTPRLLAITPATEADASMPELWLTSGADVDDIAVLLRVPGAGPTETLRTHARIRDACRSLKIRTVLSVSSIDRSLFETLDCAGVQLRADPGTEELELARSAVGTGLLGRSCHGVPRPADHWVDYTCVAPIFDAGPGKAGVGLALLREWASAGRTPVFALGGVHGGNAADCVQAGARGLAGIRCFFDDADRVAETTRAFLAALAGPR